MELVGTYLCAWVSAEVQLADAKECERNHLRNTGLDNFRLAWFTSSVRVIRATFSPSDGLVSASEFPTMTGTMSSRLIMIGGGPT